MQAENKKMDESRSMEISGAKIFWDENIEQISRVYGDILIDFAHYLFEERFIVGFAYRSQCC